MQYLRIPFRNLSCVVFTISTITLVSACGGGGGGNGGGGENHNNNSYARFSTDSYPPFATEKSVSDLEGTWIMFQSGTVTVGDTLIVTGSNYTEQYDQFYNRSLVRIKSKSGVPNAYFIYSCASGAHITSATATSTILLPISSEGGGYLSYPMSIVDAVTMQGQHSRPWGWIGNSGQAMSYELTFKLKRISDDPYAEVSSTTDAGTSQITNNGCFFESQGTYVATEDDEIKHNFRQEGTFYTVSAYPAISLDNDISFISWIFDLSNYSNLHSYFSDGNLSYYTVNDAMQTISGNASTYSVIATNNVTTKQMMITISP